LPVCAAIRYAQLETENQAMKTTVRWHAGSASDPGLQRTVNEDRVWLDEARGIFLVVDGLGGHAAGETAATTAVDIIRQHLDPEVATDLESLIRTVVCAANNEIFRLAEENPAWRGMACVLTLAVMRDDHVVVGHVGDSRLYLFWNGKLTKITSDHSPVGEQEDQGLLTEKEAMQHPRRNEVFRDVGSAPRLSDDSQFIETRSFLFRDDAALLLCSDGLTDCVAASEIAAILERYDGDADRSAQLLIEAANAAGGRDNISVVFVAGSEFVGASSRGFRAARTRHAATRPRSDSDSGGFPQWARYLLILLVAVAAGFGLWRTIVRVTSVPAPGSPREQPAPAAARSHIIEVSPSNARGIIDALNQAVNGDTISVPPGDFLGPLILKDGVNIIAKVPRQSVIRSDAAAVSEQGAAIVARGVHDAVVNGLKITADDTHPLKTGIIVVDSSVVLANLDISGAVYTGIRIEGNAKPYLADNFIHGNGGAGVGIHDTAAPTLVNNQIMQNGLMVNAARPGIEVGPLAQPLLDRNLVSGNGADDPLKTGTAEPKPPPGEH
jgi:serine/threonine protein phosphatase PrpC